MNDGSYKIRNKKGRTLPYVCFSIVDLCVYKKKYCCPELQTQDSIFATKDVLEKCWSTKYRMVVR